MSLLHIKTRHGYDCLLCFPHEFLMRFIKLYVILYIYIYIYIYIYLHIHTVLYYTILYHYIISLYYIIILYYIILNDIILNYIILYYTIWYYTIWYYIILYIFGDIPDSTIILWYRYCTALFLYFTWNGLLRVEKVQKNIGEGMITVEGLEDLAKIILENDNF